MAYDDQLPSAEDAKGLRTDGGEALSRSHYGGQLRARQLGGTHRTSIVAMFYAAVATSSPFLG